MSGIPTTTSSQEFQSNQEDSFQWDESSQLYFHAGSGFYHDPNAGWYYSSRDGLYYKFEDGNYVLLGSCKDDKIGKPQWGGNYFDKTVGGKGVETQVVEGGAAEEERTGTSFGQIEGTDMHDPKNMPPPSEWLEDTLIELYLSGYSNSETISADNSAVPQGGDYKDNLDCSAVGAVRGCTQKVDGKQIPESNNSVADSDENVLKEVDWEEELWRAQYGQVVRSGDEPELDSLDVDLWDWALVTGPKKDGRGQISRLVGRLVRPSTKLHPSISSAGFLKTAPICQVHFDLVQVATGQVYKLRTPSAKHLASVSSYDSSNPTKDWGFPELSLDQQTHSLWELGGKKKSETTRGCPFIKEASIFPDQCFVSEKGKRSYRDRAAERRKLHGGFGVGPGQKSSLGGYTSETSPIDTNTEEAKIEALNMSFGAGSYARRILESMGWKEGEALGKTTKGIVEPLQAVGNVGSAGLGYPQNSTVHK